MSLHILDTDTLTLFQDGQAAVCKHAKDHPQKDLAITVLTVEEQFVGLVHRAAPGQEDRQIGLDLSSAR
jgi:hypothetical protein